VAALDLLEPEWFMGENVPGVVKNLRPILRDLRERFAWVDWRKTSAASFGVAQDRERVCIIAGPKPVIWPVGGLVWRTLQDEFPNLLDAEQRRGAVNLSNRPCRTIGTRGNTMVHDGTRRRTLTVHESRVLMGWDERYDALLAQQTKTAAYRILGNGCVPAWVEAHARAVLDADG
jgi:site-specific DNA-cytosine methylase